jgi:hypothetical protein
MGKRKRNTTLTPQQSSILRKHLDADMSLDETKLPQLAKSLHMKQDKLKKHISQLQTFAPAYAEKQPRSSKTGRFTRREV